MLNSELMVWKKTLHKYAVKTKTRLENEVFQCFAK